MSKIVADIIYKTYQSIDGTKISLAERERLNIVNSDFTYGEIHPATFGEILEIAQPQKGDIFYDLGSGAGKAIYCAALLYDWKKCCGIELLPALHQTSMSLLHPFKTMPEVQKHFPNKELPIEFIEGDFLKIDFSDADIIFLHATTYGPMIMDPLKLKLRELKPGARVIVGTKQLDSDYFEKISEDVQLLGWGESTLFTYRKK